MKAMGISKFKAQTAKILEEVAETQENIIITKRGKPVVKIIPYHYQETLSKPGKLSNTLVFEKDILSPLGEDMWDVTK